MSNGSYSLAHPTDAEVNRLIKLWQKRLGLSDWDIAWRWASSADLLRDSGYASIANTSCDQTQQTAIIHFAIDIDWTVEEFHSDHNFEDTVVHELLHIRMAYADDKLDTMLAVVLPRLTQLEADSIGNLVMRARERYVETARAIIQEAKWRQ